MWVKIEVNRLIAVLGALLYGVVAAADASYSFVAYKRDSKVDSLKSKSLNTFMEFFMSSVVLSQNEG